MRSGAAGLALLRLGPKPAAGAGHRRSRRRHRSIRRRRRQGGLYAIGCARYRAVPPKRRVRPSGRVRLAPALCAKRIVTAVGAPDMRVEPADVAPECLRVSSQGDGRWPSLLLLRHGCRWRRREAGRPAVGSGRRWLSFEHLLQETLGLVAVSSWRSHGLVAASSWGSCQSHRRLAEPLEPGDELIISRFAHRCAHARSIHIARRRGEVCQGLLRVQSRPLYANLFSFYDSVAGNV